jgi:hypothetical protein
MSTQKNLVAIAVGAIVAATGVSAFAGGVKATKGIISTQYAAAVGAGTTGASRKVSLATLGAASIQARLNAEYAANDKITFTFACNCLVDTTLPSTITATGGANNPTFALLSSSAGSATYRVTALSSAGNSTKNAVVALPNTIEVDMGLVTGSSITVAFSASTSAGDVFDTSNVYSDSDTTYAGSATLVSLYSQFTGGVASGGSLDGIVDVNPGGTTTPLTTFSTGASDVLTLTTSTTALTSTQTRGSTNSRFDKTADVSSVTYTVKGDFSWAGQTLKDTIFAPGCANSTTASKVTLVAATAGSVSFDCVGRDAVGTSAANGATTLTITPNAQTGLTAIPTGKFTASAAVNYFSPASESGANGKTAQSVIATDKEAGEWTINGAQIFVPYMPYGSTIDQIIYVANKSSVAGDVSLQYINTDTTAVVNVGKIGSVGARSTKNIAGLIRDALPATVLASGRVAFIVTINAPSGDVDMLASYKIGDDRAFVQVRKLNP